MPASSISLASRAISSCPTSAPPSRPASRSSRPRTSPAPAGIPATAGFIGKFFVFKAALEAGLYALALIGILNSLVSVGYYLKVVYILYMRDPVDADPPPALAPADRLALALCAVGIFALGIFPGRLWQLAQHAAQSLPLSGP